MSKKKSFNDLLKSSNVPVLVDFYADWCQPCHVLSPIIAQTAKEFSGKLKVIKLNVDKNHHASSKYQIRSIPTMILFKKGKPIWRYSGVMQKAQLSQALASKLPT